MKLKYSTFRIRRRAPQRFSQFSRDSSTVKTNINGLRILCVMGYMIKCAMKWEIDFYCNRDFVKEIKSNL